MGELMTFGQAIDFLKEGKMIAREGWNGKGLFVFMQVPAVIDMNIVPKMQSLPQSVKDEFIERNKNGSKMFPDIDAIEMNTIKYSNQMALVKPDNSINGWAPSAADTLAKDWVIVG